MSNIIADRIAFFLKDFPPFHLLDKEVLEELAASVRVLYIDNGESVFSEGDENLGYCYILRKGSIHLTQKREGKETLLDCCGPGEIFGVRSILTRRPYIMTASAKEESLLYEIEADFFKQLMIRQEQFALFFASGYAAGQVVAREDQKGLSNVLTVEDSSLKFTEGIISCSVNTSIQEAANLMSKHNVGSILIASADGVPQGIVTDRDLRNKVVAQALDVQLSVRKIMSGPVRTVSSAQTSSTAQMTMIQNGIHHLVITEDGSPQSPAIGMISDHDILVSSLNHPAALLKAIKKTDNPDEWAEIRDRAEDLLHSYLDQETSILLVSTMINKINDAIIEKAIIRESEQLRLDINLFCWLGLGSEGREEQLLRTDQDNALIYDDSQKSNAEKISALADSVNEVLVRCGFEECPAGIMAKNPMWCQPLSEWKDYFTRWIEEPDPQAVMHSTIFFDFRPVFGSAGLAKQLRKHLLEIVKQNEIFLNFLAKNALQNPPPLSFFKNFVVERSGDHIHEFDIKKRGLLPLIDMARLMMITHENLEFYSTPNRYRYLKRMEPKNERLLEEAALAFEIMLRLRTRSGLKNGDSGRYINVAELNTLEKKQLKNAFYPIHELQELISVRYKLSYFN